jgi:hypothetical protein
MRFDSSKGQSVGLTSHRAKRNPMPFANHAPLVRQRPRRSRKESLSKSEPKENLERIHSDICGPVLPQSRKGNNQFILFIDEKTRYVIGHTMKAKSEALEKTRRAIKEFQRQKGTTESCSR